MPPKIYFEDVSLAVRLQGWSEVKHLMVSLQFGFLLETIALAEIIRFFMSHGDSPVVFHVRSKEKVEVDFLVQLSNQRFLAVEVKSTPKSFSDEQAKLLDSLKINIVERWIVTPEDAQGLPGVVPFTKIYEKLLQLGR